MTALYYCLCEKIVFKACIKLFVAPEEAGDTLSSDKLPQVMSFESASVGVEDYSGVVSSQKSELTSRLH